MDENEWGTPMTKRKPPHDMILIIQSSEFTNKNAGFVEYDHDHNKSIVRKHAFMVNSEALLAMEKKSANNPS